MPNSYFRFKQFTVHQELAAMKVTTDACLFGAWVAADLHAQSPACSSVLDIGAGTGLLSLMLAQQVDAQIDAVEIEQQTARQASQNFEGSPWNGRLNVIEGDVRTIRFDHDYDVIISNPPFYENELAGNNHKKNMAHHDEGLLLKELIAVIAKTCSENGSFFLLIPFKRFDEIRTLCEGAGLWWQKICKVKQSASHSVFRVMIRGGRKKTTIGEEEITIRESQEVYTERFKELLRPYYLYL